MLEGVDDCRLEIKRTRLLYRSFSLFSNPGNLIKVPADLFFTTGPINFLCYETGLAAVIVINVLASAIVEFLPQENWAELPHGEIHKSNPSRTHTRGSQWQPQGPPLIPFPGLRKRHRRAKSWFHITGSPAAPDQVEAQQLWLGGVCLCYPRPIQQS